MIGIWKLHGAWPNGSGSIDSSDSKVMPSFDPRYSQTSDVAREAVIPMSRVDEVRSGWGVEAWKSGI